MAQKHSTLMYVLRAFLPYSRENLLINYKPKQFFAELARTTGQPQARLVAAYYRARKSGLLTAGAAPQLTRRGRQKVQPFVCQKLSNHGKLMVIFDIPESIGPRRRRFRALLRELEFTQVQQSVWISSYDHREYLKEIVKELGLRQCVQIYEAARLPL